MKRKIGVLVILVVLMIFSFNTTNTYAGILDDVISGAKDFVGSGSSSSASIDQSQLKSTSKDINSAIMIISFVVVAVVGISLGIKFMMAGVEEKAEVKKSLVTFVIGCGVAYGAYGIWRVLLTFLNTL